MFISENKFNDIKNKYGVPKEGDILLTSVGTLGIPYLIETDDPFYFKDGNLTWFRNFNGINNNYLFYFLISEEAKNKFDEITIGSTQKALTIISLKDIKISLPNLKTQVAIVQKLECLDRKIKSNTAYIQTLIEQLHSIYQNWFSNFKYPEATSELEECIPLGWLNSNVFDNITEVREKNKENNDYTVLSVVKEGEFKPSDDFFTKQVYSKDTTNYKIIKRNQVGYNPARANIGSIAMLTDFDIGLVSPVYAVFEMKELINPKFFYYYMKQPMFLESVKQHAIGTTRQNFPFEAFKMFPLIVPPMELQKRFEEIEIPIEKKIKKLQEENALLAEIRDALLPKLMSGEILVEVGED